MSLGNVIFNINSQGLGKATANILKVPAMVLTGVTVAGATNVVTGTSYQIFSKDEAINMGITATGSNAFAFKQISDFYDGAGPPSAWRRRDRCRSVGP